jgi:hypothetical protein
MESIGVPFCYSCQKVLGEPAIGGHNINGSLPCRLFEDYRMVDLKLFYGDITIYYATPVCAVCLDGIKKFPEHYQENLKINVMNSCIVHNQVHPMLKNSRGIAAMPDEVLVTGIDDLTPTLIQERIIRDPALYRKPEEADHAV